MKQEIINKVLMFGDYETREYRYIEVDTSNNKGQFRVIKRIRREYLNTTASLSDASGNNPFGWEIVWTENVSDSEWGTL